MLLPALLLTNLSDFHAVAWLTLLLALMAQDLILVLSLGGDLQRIREMCW